MLDGSVMKMWLNAERSGNMPIADKFIVGGQEIELADSYAREQLNNINGGDVFIDDNVTSVDKVWSSQKVSQQLQSIGELTNLQTTDKSSVVNALNEVFQDVSNGKTLVASAITDKGVDTLATDSFQTIANNIREINQTQQQIVGQNTLNKCGSKKFKFAVFSDVHTTTDDTANANVKLNEAINFVTNNNCDFIAITGDLCNYSHTTELPKYKEIVSNYSIPIYEVAGNHDATQGGLNEELWLDVTGQTPYYEIIHNNEVFLFLSQKYWQDDANGKMIPQTYRDWLTSKLEEHKTKTRVFLFFHQYMPNYEGFGYRNGNVNNSYLNGVLSYFENLISTYKNVIWFSGHSHTRFSYQTDYPNCIAYNQNGNICTMIHTPTLQDGEYYIVTVYEHLIEIQGYKNGVEVDSIYYAIDDYIYTSLIESVVLNNNTLNFANTESQQLIATVTPSTQQDLLVWESSNTNVATVVNGLVTPISNGSCNIIARCGDKSATCSIVVDISESELYYSINKTLNGCTLSNDATRIRENETYIATITEGANTSIANVIVKMGGVDISSSAYNSDSKTIGIDIVTGNIEIIVNINKLVTGISLNNSSLSFNAPGEIQQLIATVTPSDAINKTVTWESSNTSVATVENGLVSAVANGNCNIIAKCNGKQAICSITVSIRQKTVVYHQDSVVANFAKAGTHVDLTGVVGGRTRIDLLSPMQQGIKYYMRCDSFKLADGTDINMTNDKLYMIGDSYLADGTKYKLKICQDYDNIVGVDCLMTYGTGSPLTTSNTIAYFQSIMIKASSSCPLTFPLVATMTNFEIFTYGETIE